MVEEYKLEIRGKRYELRMGRSYLVSPISYLFLQRKHPLVQRTKGCYS